MSTTSVKKAFIDSNILVYAYHSNAPNHGRAIDLLDTLLRQGEATLSIQNIVELSNVITSKGRPPVDFEKLAGFTSNIRDAFGVIPYTVKTILAAIDLSHAHGIHFFDGLLAATMLENDISTIYTENVKDFEKIPGINAVNPFG